MGNNYIRITREIIKLAFKQGQIYNEQLFGNDQKSGNYFGYLATSFKYVNYAIHIK